MHIIVIVIYALEEVMHVTCDCKIRKAVHVLIIFVISPSHSCSSWGESFFIAVQLCILLAQMFYYNQQMIYMAVFCPVYGAVVWFLTSQFASIELLSMLQACVIPLLLTSRVCMSEIIDSRYIIAY